VGTATTSGTVSGGSASVSYTLPAGTGAATYTIQAVYSGSTNFLSSTDSAHSLTVNPASTTTTSSSTTVAFSASSQSVSLSATVTSTAGTVNSGTVTFTILSGSTPVGTAATSTTVSGGSASVSYTLPGGTLAGVYTIQAVYNPGANFQTSSDNTHTLKVTAPASLNVNNAFAPFNPASETVVLTATVTSPGGIVNEGTVTFTVFNSANVQIGGPAISGTVTNGLATADYTLPGGTPVGTYKITGSYSDAGIFLNIVEDPPTLTVYDTSYQVRYAAHLDTSDSVIDIVNTGGNGAAPYGPGLGAAAGNICVNVYAFSPDEQEISCCSCLLTPGEVASLSAQRDLIGNWLTSAKPTSITIALLATLAGPNATAGTCTNSAAAATGANFPLAPTGMQAWGTSAESALTGTFAITETPFLSAIISPSQVTSIVSRCASIVGNASGYGVCNSCQAGALGATKQ
jgi:hypothetical protein